MASTSCNSLAEELLHCCLEDRSWPPALLDGLIEGDCSIELFRIVIERLADLFEPRLCLVYARLFSEIVERVLPAYRRQDLFNRYLRVRVPASWAGPDPEQVCVLSRVTLGADIAVTSVFIDAAKQRFPHARVLFAGSSKAYQLFASDSRVEHLPIEYPRAGTLRERLLRHEQLRSSIPPGALVLDPDSRLTQLGLLPITEDANYRFFESRGYGGDSSASLGQLARQWCIETLGVTSPQARISPAPVAHPHPASSVAVSLGVGENPAKGLGDMFEACLLSSLAERWETVLIDLGGGGDEGRRVERAIAASGVDRARFEVWNGSFAGFVSLLSQCSSYAGYDSAGQHAAAACGVPLIAIFAGFVSDRMLARWTPSGAAAVNVIPVPAGTAWQRVLDQVVKKL